MNVYEQRIISYADILGWSDSCNDLSKEPDMLKATNAIKDYALKFSLSVKEMLKDKRGLSSAMLENHAGIRFSFFSDNFAVSAPVEYGSAIFKILAFASHELLRANFLIRGSVTLGSLYHDDNGVIFGPALKEAVDMEKKACYPRMLCSPSLIEFLDKTDYKTKSIVLDIEDKWVANIACGSIDALTDLKMILKKEISKQTKVMEKWKYMEVMLPRMYKEMSAPQVAAPDSANVAHDG